MNLDMASWNIIPFVSFTMPLVPAAPSIPFLSSLPISSTQNIFEEIDKLGMTEDECWKEAMETGLGKDLQGKRDKRAQEDRQVLKNLMESDKEPKQKLQEWTLAHILNPSFPNLQLTANSFQTCMAGLSAACPACTIEVSQICLPTRQTGRKILYIVSWFQKMY